MIIGSVILMLPVTGICQIDISGQRRAPQDTSRRTPRPALNRGSVLFFSSFYPVNTDPYVAYKTPMYSKEKILFEASPEVRINFYNSIYSGLIDHRKHTEAYYLHFRPVLRMFAEDSKPVKTPSTPILLGTQHLWINYLGKNNPLKRHEFHMYALSFETGHYSNGQNGGAFTGEFTDGTPESEAKYDEIDSKTNLSAILNRKNGNFSTNLTELKGNIRLIRVDDDFLIRRSHTITLGETMYHNLLLGVFDVGGYSKNDIKIYGRWRTQAGYEYMCSPVSWKGKRFAISEGFEYIHGAHPWVEPLRFDTKLTFFPFPRMTDFGFAISHTWGHDNYNYRFVDHGHQVSIGLTWSIFPPFIIQPPFK